MTMPLKFLGSTGVKVSEICFGTMTFGSKWAHIGTLGQKEANELVARCLDAGVNFFDTANVYSMGESEMLLGKALGARRKEILLATKVRGRMGQGPNEVGLSRVHIMDQIDASLTRLGTDYIDLYQVHGWDAKSPLEETMRALDDCVRSGKVRYIGASNYAGWHLMKSLAVSERLGLEKYVTLQPQYSLMNRDIERELVPLCLDQGLGILPWSPLAGGFLTGKYRRGKPRPTGARRTDPENQFLKFDEEKGFDVIEVLDGMAKEHGGTVSQAALNWLRAKPGVTSVIVGAKSMEQLEDDLGCVEWQLSPSEVERLDAMTALPPAYPFSMIESFHTTR